MDFIGEVVSVTLKGLMVVMPVAPYIPFFTSTDKQRVLQSFSLGLCYVLLTSNVLRIGFYIGEPFEVSLLIQSIVIISAMLALLYLSAKYLHTINFTKAFVVFSGLSAVTLLFSYIVRGSNFLVQSIGAASSLVEVMLAVPQIVKNYKTKTGDGLPLTTVFGWIAGDFFKTMYFIVLSVPYQFVMCGVFQLLCDAIVVSQIMMYSPYVIDNQLIKPLKRLMGLFFLQRTL